MDLFKLSRDWFNFCFENPEKISPNHSAMYFFCIEHCNRLGWKEKFGLPMEMTKDAIGIKNYRTFSNTFNDLVEWGFIKVIQKSKNQYSSNIIAIAENAKAPAKAPAKALDRAMLKHSQKQSQKQVHGIVGIDIQETNKQETRNNILIWRDDFDVYLNQMREAWKTIVTPEYISQREIYHKRIDIKKTLEKACIDYWATKEGWAYKKKKCKGDINWKSTFNNSLTQKVNQVWKDSDNSAPKIF